MGCGRVTMQQLNRIWENQETYLFEINDKIKSYQKKIAIPQKHGVH